MNGFPIANKSWYEEVIWWFCINKCTCVYYCSTIKVKAIIAMAVFEKKKALKVSIDDTVSLSCTLEAAQKTADHMVYFIQIHMHFHCINHAC
jgi:hypothetical protein